MDIVKLVAELRAQRSDTETVEVKKAAGGFPDDLALVLSAFANRPGGGTIVFGLDEGAGFAATGVYDTKLAQQSLAHLARNALTPPVRLTCEVVDFEGAKLVVADIMEATAASKPVSVTRTGRAYLRQYDGTFPLSDMERQVFLSARGLSEAEQQRVAGATMADLDGDAVARFVQERRSGSPVFSGWDDADIVAHAHVTTMLGQPTVAGLLAFGRFPQSFLPTSSIVASQWSGPSRQAKSQLLDSREFVGPVGTILEQAVAWVSRSTPTAIVERADGHLQDAPSYPPRAVRELVANALVHRDLGSYVAAPINLILEPGQLVISNIGGLVGMHVQALGKTSSHLRNPHLAGLLLVARTSDGLRIIERLGSGIPRTMSALQDAGMEPPVFHDSGIRFTARLLTQRVKTAPPVKSGTTVAETVNAETIIAALRRGSTTIPDLMADTGMSARQVRYALEVLKDNGQVARFRQPHDRKDHFREV